MCGLVAALSNLFVRSTAGRALIPLACLGLIVVVAKRYGARAGIFGSVVATLVFCLSMFPSGSLRVEDPAERANVVWMFLGGISLSYLLSSDDQDKDDGVNAS
jgi:Na+/proline symporter